MAKKEPAKYHLVLTDKEVQLIASVDRKQGGDIGQYLQWAADKGSEEARHRIADELVKQHGAALIAEIMKLLKPEDMAKIVVNRLSESMLTQFGRRF